MAKTLKEVRLALAKLDPIHSGQWGERFARQWLNRNKWPFVDFDQGRTTMHQRLRKLGGKRPDFIIESGTETDVIVADAKFATTDDGKSFAMPDWEIEKYRQFKVFAESEVPGTTCEVLFMVFPKEFDGKKFVWVELHEFSDGTACEVRGHPGTQVSLENRPSLWEDNEDVNS